MEHMSDRQLAELAVGSADSASREVALEHLASCFDCWAAWVASLKAQRTLRDVVNPTRQAVPGSPVGDIGRRPIVLEPAGPLQWAAQSTVLPILISQDHQFRVRFRQPDPVSPIRAYLVAPMNQLPKHVSIAFPSVARVFRFGSDWSVELPDIEAEHLTNAVLEFPLGPIPPLPDE